MNNKNEILNRLKKLKEITVENGATENETFIAIKLYHSLLAKYNLSQVEVDGVSDDNIKKEKVKESRYGYKRERWVKNLYDAICSLYFCKFYYCSKGLKKRFCIVGKEINKQTSSKIIENVIMIINNLAYLSYLEKEASLLLSGKKVNKRNFENSFKFGVVDRISKRCKDLKKETSKKETSNSNEGVFLPALQTLYKQTDNEIKVYLDSIGVELKKGRYRRPSVDRFAYSKGYNAGKNIPLTEELEEKHCLIDY